MKRDSVPGGGLLGSSTRREAIKLASVVEALRSSLIHRFALPARRIVARVLPKPWKQALRRGLRDFQRWRWRLGQRRVPRLLPPTSSYDVVLFPIIDWSYRFQRPQQLTREMARRGHRVFYLRTDLGGGEGMQVKKVAERVGVVGLPGPGTFNLYRDRLEEETVKTGLAALARLRSELRLEEVVCWVQFPSWRPLVEAAKSRWGWRVVYDCIDDHSGFAATGAVVEEEEEALVTASDLVVASSHLLLARWQERSPRTLLLPNAADFEHFHQPAQTPHVLRGLQGPIIGYYGAIAEWFDVDMVATAAEARSEWQFVLIGNTVGADVSRLRRLRNVHLLGERPYQELPGYLHAFDVATIPFLRTPLTEATNPVKFYEYLSAGKPVVAVDLPELEPFTDLYFPVRSADEFTLRLEEALSERSPGRQRARIEIARSHTWRSRADELSEAVRSVFPRVAIVIAAYSDVARLRECLESLFSKTQYPNFEVVVVDNSCAADVRQLLREQAGRQPHLKVVLNERNLGFPRANNIGIEAAGACDYVVLLNDDTVVTRGWLGRLLRHLETPGVELVGPVTNWTGNEARIEVVYDSMDDMERFAADYTLRHEGVVWDIPMLAMYCVAMRRGLLDRIGFLDERFGIGMFEDDDFSRRVRAARGRVVCAEDVFIHHWGRASFGAMDEEKYRRLFEENRAKFEEKWGEAWRPHTGRQRGSEIQ
jgi:GT2 family glycosyltransferase/glycosyltransferase involved in cell wall biosynthesis